MAQKVTVTTLENAIYIEVIVGSTLPQHTERPSLVFHIYIETVLIFQNGINGVIGKPVSHFQMLEHEILGRQRNHHRQKT